MKTLQCQGRRFRSWAMAGMLLTVAAWNLAVPTAAVAVDEPRISMDQVESAILEADRKEGSLKDKWSGAAELLASVGAKTGIAELRLVAAHIAMAVNDNNRALGLLMTLNGKDSLEDCRAWAEQFAQKHDQRAIAHYFLGDVLERLENPKGALAEFEAALSKEPSHVLSLHARGVARGTRNEFDLARGDLSAAEKLDPGFVELLVSRGTYMVQKRNDPKKALEWFDRALAKNAKCLLALNGAGSVRVLLREWSTARKQLDEARKLAVGDLEKLLPVIDLNSAHLASEYDKVIEQSLADAHGLKPGMSTQEVISAAKSWTPEQRQDFANAQANAAAHNRGIVSNPLVPNTFEGGIKGEIGKSAIGPYGSVGVHGNAAWDFKGTTQGNMDRQQSKVDAFQSAFGITAKPISNAEGFYKNQTEFKRYQNGISSQEIARGLDPPEWFISAVYGLMYAVAPAPEKAKG
jgi:tetratricopeptide (TPR) repeat protein